MREAKKILNSHRTDLHKLGVKALSLFGSIARNKGTPKSDIDILVEFDAKRGLFAFLDLKRYLERLLMRKVDLVTREALHPALKKRILGEAESVF